MPAPIPFDAPVTTATLLFSFPFFTYVPSINSCYQGTGWPRWKNPPLGPSSGSAASCALVLPPSLGSIGALGPPISVLTQPGCAEFTLILLSRTSYARCTVKAFGAAFDASYANVL